MGYALPYHSLECFDAFLEEMQGEDDLEERNATPLSAANCWKSPSTSAAIPPRRSGDRMLGEFLTFEAAILTPSAGVESVPPLHQLFGSVSKIPEQRMQRLQLPHRMIMRHFVEPLLVGDLASDLCGAEA
jgi:hypothetical protein